MCPLQPYTANLLDDPLSVVLLVLHHVASPSGLTPMCVAVTIFEVSYACLFSQRSFLLPTSTLVSCRLLAARAARKWPVYLYLTGITWYITYGREYTVESGGELQRDWRARGLQAIKPARCW